MSQYGIKNFAKIANAKLNPDTTSFEGVQEWLTTWFCFKFNTTPNDYRLLDMTLEELLVLYNMHRIKEDPTYYEKVVNPVNNNYEEWLKGMMGDNYLSEEDSIKVIQEDEKQLKKEIDKKYPKNITTDFTKLQEDGE